MLARLEYQYTVHNNPTGSKRVAEVQTKASVIFREITTLLADGAQEAIDDEEIGYLRGNHSMTSLIRKRQLLEARIDDSKETIALIDQIIERKRTGTATGQTK
jgi:hypothetical protein